MLLLRLFPLLLLCCLTSSYDLNKFIRSVEYQLDSGHSCMSKYKHKAPINLEFKVFANQLQDHFDALNRKTWNHIYFIHSPENQTQMSDVPIILVGGEGPTEDMYNLFEELLPELGNKSTTFTLSHRYYETGGGNISPTDHFNASRDSRLLSSKQALADLAYFIERVVIDEYKFTKPPIIFGCSYPGSLSIWFREKYPHLSTGAIALSGPIRALDNFHQYLEVGERAVKDLLPKCYPLLVSGKKILRDTARNNSTAFAKQMNLCTDTGFTQWEDIVTVGWVWVSLNFAGDLGQQGDIRGAEVMCELLETSGPFALTAYNLGGTLGGPCKDPAKVIKDNTLTPNHSAKSNPDWFWQKCTEFGWFKTHSNDSLFELFPLAAYHKLCQDDYGVDVDLLHLLLDQTNDFYGATNITSLTNLLILNGADDPWHAASMYKYGSDYNRLVSRWIPHGHHCTFVDRKFTDEAKRIAKEAVHTWIK